MSANLPISREGRVDQSAKLKPKYLAPKDTLDTLIENLGPQLIKQRFVKNCTENKHVCRQNRCFKAVLKLIDHPELITKEIEKSLFALTDCSGTSILAALMQQRELGKAEFVMESYKILLLKGEHPLQAAIRMGMSWDFIYTLIEEDMGNFWDGNGEGPIPVCMAVKKNRPDLLELLIPKVNGHVYSRVNYYSKKKRLNLPLIALAVAKGNNQCLDTLLRLKKESLCSIRVGNDMWTVLHLAVRMNQLEMLEHLLTVYASETMSIINCPDEQDRTPLMLAASLGYIPILELLVKLGANPKIPDINGKTAHTYAEENDHTEAASYLLNQCKSPKATKPNFQVKGGNLEFAQEHYKGNFYLQSPENIIFQGGGAKGIAYLGAVVGLENCDMLENVKRFGGTSAGAITATLLALGLDSKAIEELLTSTQGEKFLDHPFTAEKIKDSVTLENGLKLALSIGESIKNTSPGPAIYEKISGFTGICKGTEFLKWMEKVIFDATGIEFCTFGELANLIKDKRFRHLHVIATDLVKKEIVDFNSEDRKWKNLIISHSLRCSISLPIVYESFTPLFKIRINNTFIYSTHPTLDAGTNSGNYEALMEAVSKQDKRGSAYVDGGCLMNFPLDLFDQKKYISAATNQKNRDFNYRTLGFRLYSQEKEENKIHKNEIDKNILQLIEIGKVFRHAESIINQAQSDPQNENRIIRLDHQEIGTRDFHITPASGSGKRVINKAEATTIAFFENQRQKISKVISTSPPKESKAKEEKVTSLVNNPVIGKEKALARAQFLSKLSCSIVSLGLYAFSKENRTVIKKQCNFKILKSKNRELRLFDSLSQANDIISQSRSFYNHNIKQIMSHVIFENNREHIDTLSKNNVSVNLALEYKGSIIHLAIHHKLYQAFEGLLTAHDFKAKGIQCLDRHKNTVLHAIAQRADTEAFDILERNNKIKLMHNALNNNNEHPLIIAGETKNPLIIRKLFESDGIKLTAIHPETKRTLLYYLAGANLENEFRDFINRAKKQGVLEKLIKLENKSNEVESNSKTNSIIFQTKSRTILRSLIEEGIDLTRKEIKTNKSLLHCLVENKDIGTIYVFCKKLSEKSKKEILEHTAVYPVRPGRIKTTPKTALILAVEKNYSKILKLLVESGADFRSKIDKWTPIEWADKLPTNKSYLYLKKQLEKPIKSQGDSAKRLSKQSSSISLSEETLPKASEERPLKANRSSKKVRRKKSVNPPEKAVQQTQPQPDHFALKTSKDKEEMFPSGQD